MIESESYFIFYTRVNKAIIFSFSDKDVKWFIELSSRSKTKKSMYVWSFPSKKS